MGLTVESGKLVVRDDKLGTEQACCCGGPCRSGAQCDEFTVTAQVNVFPAGGYSEKIVNEYGLSCGGQSGIWSDPGSDYDNGAGDGVVLSGASVGVSCHPDGLYIQLYVQLTCIFGPGTTDCQFDAVVPLSGNTIEIPLSELQGGCVQAPANGCVALDDLTLTIRFTPI